MGRPVRFVDAYGRPADARHARCGSVVVASVDASGFLAVCARCGVVPRREVMGPSDRPFHPLPSASANGHAGAN